MGDKALFDPHDIERLHPVGPAAKRLGLRQKLAVERIAVACRNRQLISMFARKRDPEKPPLNARHRNRAAAHIGKALIVDGRI